MRIFPFAFALLLAACQQPSTPTSSGEVMEIATNEVFDFKDPEIDDEYIHFNKTDSVNSALEKLIVKGDSILVFTTTTHNCCSGNALSWFEDENGIHLVRQDAYDQQCDSQCFYLLSFKIYYPKPTLPKVYFGNHEITAITHVE